MAARRPEPDPDQLELFPGATASPAHKPSRRSSVGPAAVAERLRTLAKKLPAELRFGTSSWSFPGWAGLVYDRQASSTTLARNGLPAYARHPLLRTVGIDRSYYAPLPPEDFAAYAAVVPDDFRFLVKAHQQCTVPFVDSAGRRTRPSAAREPNPRFLDPDYARTHIIDPFVTGLADRAGPLLFQFSPMKLDRLGGASAFLDRLHTFLEKLPRGPLYALELRNPELLTADYRSLLEQTGVCHCYNVHPSMPEVAQQAQRLPATTQPALLIRWMLHHTLGYEQARQHYEPFNEIVDRDPVTRDALSALTLTALTQRQQVYVIANNKAEGSAPRSLFELASTIAENASTAP